MGIKSAEINTKSIGTFGIKDFVMLENRQYFVTIKDIPRIIGVEPKEQSVFIDIVVNLNDSSKHIKGYVEKSIHEETGIPICDFEIIGLNKL